jgi:hypothetical protein
MSLSYNNSRYSSSKITDFSQWTILTGIVLGKNLELVALIFTFLLVIKERKQIYVRKNVLLLLVSVFLFSIFLIYKNAYDYGKFLQQYILVFLFVLCYIQFWIINRNDINSLFLKYIKVMYFLCLLGLLQFIVCLFVQIDIFPFTLDGYIQKIPDSKVIRIHSIMSEAGNFGTCLVTVVAYIFFDKNFYSDNKLKSLIIFTTFILTFVTISYVSLFIILIVKICSKLKFLRYMFVSVIIVLIPAIFAFMSNNIEKREIESNDFLAVIQKKLVQSTVIFNSNATIGDMEALNASSYAFSMNMWVAINAPDRLTGTGLGTHKQNYENIYPPNDYYMYGLNSNDAYSLLIRMFSEFGLIGLICYFFFLLKYYNPHNIINKCVLLLLVALLIRGGNYLLYGTIFFHFMYYYTSNKNKFIQYKS